MKSPDSLAGNDLDVLVVGAGPTGLALAAQLQWFGVRFRIVERSLDRARESRALAVQARTLELFDVLDLATPLVARGNTSARLVLHVGARRAAEVQLGPVRAVDTRFPFILFVSQAETEQVLGEHLSRSGVPIERGVELLQFSARSEVVDCVLRDRQGHREAVRAAYLVGCDGAHSTVREGAGFKFEGGSYPQDFVLGDLEADGALESNAINSFVGGGGVAMFFPLGSPRSWRVIAMRAKVTSIDESAGSGALTSGLTLDELQAIVDPPTKASVRLRDPAWLTRFHLHHRQTAHYRSGRVFLAGDAAHIHSPVGGQGMNTGIQDAWNVGWKLGLVTRRAAHQSLLDSYETERWAVGRFLLRYTDRAFSTFTRAMSGGLLATWVREVVVPRVFRGVLGSERLRTTAFRFVSELGINYRKSPAVMEGEPRLRAGPHAGDRLPDGLLAIDGRSTSLQRAVIGPYFSLLLCGNPALFHGIHGSELARIAQQFSGLVTIHYLSSRPSPGALIDKTGDVLDSLGVHRAAQYLIRPDGYIAFRCSGQDLSAVTAYLGDWLLPWTTS
jgi:2-polyprenyl-6-methoxyphenol hydroxylase-like FAD-dependent oxidoreductase